MPKMNNKRIKLTSQSTAKPAVQYRERENPLLNHVILANLFKFCGPRDLKNCRLVCKVWRDESLQTWRKLATVNVCQDPQHEYETRHKTKSKILMSDELVRMYEDPETKNSFKLDAYPFRNFKFDGWCFFNDTPHYERFLNLFGNHVTTMNLKDCGFKEISVLESLILEKTPNLRRLVLSDPVIIGSQEGDDTRVENSSVHYTVPNVKHENLKELELSGVALMAFRFLSDGFSWLNFLRRIPFLEILTFAFEDNINDPDFEHILRAIQVIKQENKKAMPIKKLTILNLEQAALVEFPPVYADLLEQLQLPLKHLELDIGFRTPETVLEKILRIHSKTLKTLKIFKAPFSPPFANFPYEIEMGSLKHLELHGPIAPNLSFLKFTPELYGLRIVQGFSDFFEKFAGILVTDRALVYQDNKHSIIKNTNLDIVNLPKMRLLQMDFVPKDKVILQTLAKCMPRLEVLMIKATARLYPVICTLWLDTLQSLSIDTVGSFGDSEVSGIQTGKKKGVRSHLPLITNFQNLKFIRLMGDAATPETKCTHQVPTFSEDTTLKTLFLLPNLNQIMLQLPKKTSKKTNLEVCKRKVHLYLKVKKTCECGLYQNRKLRQKKN